MSDVVIVNPESIKNQTKIDQFKKSDLIHKETNKICPHLDLEDNLFKCNIHDKSWYKHTPCYSYTQIEQGNTKCRMGKHVLSTNSIINLLEMYNQKKEQKNGS